ncbi:MAG: hypothetical protein RLZZ214_3116 [Verrucomicrobiota bacterium]
MKSKAFFLIALNTFFVLVPLGSQAALPEIPENMEKAQIWKSKRLATIHEAQTDPTKGIPQLAEMLRQLKTLGYRPCPERDDVVSSIESTLLSIPGHAKYYQDKIEAMRAEVLVNSKKSEAEISKMQDEGIEFVDVWSYESLCVNAFRTLAHLPSPECVAVLGFYLNDPVGRDGKTLLGDNRSKPGDDFDPRPIHSEYAAMAIRKLGIEHPPFELYDDRGRGRVRDGEVDAWKDWWNEVKDGRRTYRFIGSSVEYGPDGPASKKVIQRVERDQKRDDERAVGHKKSSTTSVSETAMTQINKPFSIAWLVAAIGLCAAVVWYFLRGRKTA